MLRIAGLPCSLTRAKQQKLSNGSNSKKARIATGNTGSQQGDVG